MIDVKESIARLKKVNKENQIPIRVTRGLIKSAIAEIEIQRVMHGDTFATEMVLGRLKSALGEKE